MSTFTAIVLICLSSVSPDACDETNAVEVRSRHVANEMGCVTGWQEVMARAGADSEIGQMTYLKTICRRSRPPTNSDQAR